jgi:hypothetical protein
MSLLPSKQSEYPCGVTIQNDSDGSNAEPTFGLDEMLQALRRDLVAANKTLADGTPILNVGEVEIEVAFTLERSTEKGGGVNFKVFGVGVEAGGKGATGRSYTNRVKITLTPPRPYGVAGGQESEG